MGDSFEGLPENEANVTQSDFQKGKWAAEITEADMIKTLGGPQKTKFIRGFYNESLTRTLKEERSMKIAEYIDIDCDLYISTVQALEWVFASGVAVPGTLVGYDDWWRNPCSTGMEVSPLDTGEGKAHVEIAQKYKV